MRKLLGAIFGSANTTQELVKGAVLGIDKMVFTKEEKAEASAKPHSMAISETLSGESASNLQAREIRSWARNSPGGSRMWALKRRVSVATDIPA